MAINYVTLFTRIGRIVDKVNDYFTIQGTDLMGADEGADDILDEFTGRRDLVSGLQDRYEAFANAVASWIRTLIPYVDAVLGDLQTELNAPSSSPSDILPLLKERMVEDSETVNASAITAPSVAAGPSNTGTGLLKGDVVREDAEDDQRGIAEKVRFTCLTDRFGGSEAGKERFSTMGYPTKSTDSYETRGNGSGGSLSVSDVDSKVVNGGFEDWEVANTPDDWDLDFGVAGTDIFKETTVVHADLASLSLKNNAGVTTRVALSQDLADVILPRTKYAAGVWLRKDGTVNAGSNLRIYVTDGVNTFDLFNADPTALTATYALHHLFFWAPADIQSDLEIVIDWTSADSAGATAEILIDGLVITPPLEFGHVHYALFRGGVDFLADDYFIMTTVNDYAGVLQTFFNRFYNEQLPSDKVGGETIDDALAA